MYVCVLTCVVKWLYALPPRLYHNGEMSGIKSEVGDVGRRKAHGMDEESPVGVKRQRERERTRGSDGNGGMRQSLFP